MKLNKLFLIIGFFLLSSVMYSNTYLKNNADTTTELLSKILKEIEELKKGQDQLKADIKALKSAPSKGKQQPTAAQASAVKNVPIGDSMVLGNPNAPVTIIEWTDFQ